MNVDELRFELAIKSKNGTAFLFAATIAWSIILVIYLLPIEISSKNILTLYVTGILFPLAILISKVIKADWKIDENPFSKLALFLNLAQLMYFPILFWSLAKSPSQMVVFFAIITGAHIFPYGWLYKSKAYTIMAPVISTTILLIGWNIDSSNLWYIPLSMIGFLIVLNLWLYIEYYRKINDPISKSA